MARAHDEAVQLASDPSTPLGVLHELAMNNPEVHPILAENPSTYPDLLTWLSARGNPAVNAALARRAITSAEGVDDDDPTPQAENEPTVAIPSTEPAIEDMPTAAMDAVTDDGEPGDGAASPATAAETVAAAAAAAAATEALANRGQTQPQPTVAESAPTQVQPTPSPTQPLPTNGNGPARTSILGESVTNDWNYGPRPTQRLAPQQEAPQQYSQPPAVAPAAYYAAAAPQEPEERSRNTVWLALILGLVAIVALIGALFATGVLGGDGNPEATGPAVEPTQTATDPASDAATDAPTDEDVAEEPSSEVDAAASTLAAAVAASTCQSATADAAPFDAFAAVVRGAGTGWDSASLMLLDENLGGLQTRCNPGYALAVKDSSDLDDADLGDWLSPLRSAPAGAEQSSGFSSVSGNIHCTLNENSAYCTIQQFNFTPGAEGDCRPGNPATLLVDTEDARFQCGGQSAGGATLAYDRSVTNGFMACTSTSEGISCWNTLTGSGFSVARASADFTPQAWGPGRQ